MALRDVLDERLEAAQANLDEATDDLEAAKRDKARAEREVEVLSKMRDDYAQLEDELSDSDEEEE